MPSLTTLKQHLAAATAAVLTLRTGREPFTIELKLISDKLVSPGVPPGGDTGVVPDPLPPPPLAQGDIDAWDIAVQAIAARIQAARTAQGV